jgi:hypothetical protein
MRETRCMSLLPHTTLHSDSEHVPQESPVHFQLLDFASFNYTLHRKMLNHAQIQAYSMFLDSNLASKSHGTVSFNIF